MNWKPIVSTAVVVAVVIFIVFRLNLLNSREILTGIKTNGAA